MYQDVPLIASSAASYGNIRFHSTVCHQEELMMGELSSLGSHSTPETQEQSHTSNPNHMCLLLTVQSDIQKYI